MTETKNFFKISVDPKDFLNTFTERSKVTVRTKCGDSPETIGVIICCETVCKKSGKKGEAVISLCMEYPPDDGILNGNNLYSMIEEILDLECYVTKIL